MATSYIYSVQNDTLSGTVLLAQLKTEVLAETGITKTLINIIITGDQIKVMYESALTSGEETLLTAIINNHEKPLALSQFNYIKIYPELRKTSDTSFVTIGTFLYHGKANRGRIIGMKLIAKQQKGSDSYDVRIIDYNSNAIIVSKTGLTNEEYTSIDLGSISNLSDNEQLMDIQIKRYGKGNKNIYIQELIVYYDE